MDKIKTTIRIPKDLSKKLKHYAVDEEESQNTIIVEAIRNYLRSDSK